MNNTTDQMSSMHSIDGLIAALQAADTETALTAALAHIRLDAGKLTAAAIRLKSPQGGDAANKWVEAALIDAGVPAEAVHVWAEAMIRLGDRRKEPPNQRALREERAEAMRLVDALDEDDPRALQAIIRVVEFADPGACERIAAECGIKLPKPSWCNDDGEPLCNSREIAATLNVPHADVVAASQALPEEYRQLPAAAHPLH